MRIFQINLYTICIIIEVHNCFLLKQLNFIDKINSLVSRFYSLDKLKRTFKTLVTCLNSLKYYVYIIKGCRICFVLYQVNYFYIIHSLRIKVSWDIVKQAGYWVLSLFGTKTKYWSWLQSGMRFFVKTIYGNKNLLNKDTLVGSLLKPSNQYNF